MVALSQSGEMPPQQIVELDGVSYEIEQEIGSGGVGTVYKAHVAGKPNRIVALKKYKELEPDILVAIRTSMEIRLEHSDISPGKLTLPLHPALVNGWGVMTYKKGYNPEDRIRRIMESEKPRRIQRELTGFTARIIRATAPTLYECSDRGFAHLDVKPGNMKVRKRKDGQTTVGLVDIDFMANFRDGRNKPREDGVIRGSPCVMPNEIARGHSATPTTDIASLGYTALLMMPRELEYVSGILVRSGTTDSIVHNHAFVYPHTQAMKTYVTDPHQFNERASGTAYGIVEFINRALSYPPTYRPKNMTEVEQLLDSRPNPPVYTGV